MHTYAMEPTVLVLFFVRTRKGSVSGLSSSLDIHDFLNISLLEKG